MRAEIEGTPSDVMCLVKAALEKEMLHCRSVPV